MMNFTLVRSSRKIYALYVVGFFILILCGLVVKSFNDKIALMTSSVHSYQMMVDKQSQQLKAVSLEKDRLKRDLDSGTSNLRQLEQNLSKLDLDCKDKSTKLETDLSRLQQQYNSLSTSKTKIETKYKTLSKSNADAISDIERLNSENKKLRSQLQDAESSKAEQLNKLRDTLAQTILEKDRYKEQYNSLYKDYQQFADDHANVKNHRDRLQQQISEIQKLSGINDSDVSSSPVPVMDQPKVMQKPAQAASSSSSEAPVLQELQAAEPVQPVASRAPPPASKPAPLVPAPPLNLAAVSKPTPSAKSKVENDVFPVLSAQIPRVGANDLPLGVGAEALRGARNVDNSFINGNPHPIGARGGFIKPYVKQIEPGVQQQRPDEGYQRYVLHDDHLHPVHHLPQVVGARAQLETDDQAELSAADNADFTGDAGDDQFNEESAVADDYNEIKDDDLDTLNAPPHHQQYFQQQPQIQHPGLDQFGVHLPNQMHYPQQNMYKPYNQLNNQPYNQGYGAQKYGYRNVQQQHPVLSWQQQPQNLRRARDF